MSTNEEIVHFSGSRVGLFWNQADRIIISSPVGSSDEASAFSILISLEPSYRSLRQTHHFLLLYVVMNTAVLSFLGVYRVVKMYRLPLGRLAQRAEDYKEDDELLFSVRKEDNELLRLSSALNTLMRRLAEERSKLRAPTSWFRPTMPMRAKSMPAPPKRSPSCGSPETASSAPRFFRNSISR